MALRIEPHAEPIPGYRLIERLGGGGFGEVWKAEAPGGLFKAMKFVYGEVDDDVAVTRSDSNATPAPAAPDDSDGGSALSFGRDASDGVRAKQEFTSLKRVKTVRHPYILSLERIDVIQRQLVIVMELADMTLWDRFKECRGSGLPGIPREELLSYMQETSEALDYMNEKYQLQHLDIKPQNIFLISGHIKVGDFGLVKDMANRQNATITGGVTPVYAAPETFDNWLSRQSDQYSLAIVYQELLTGRRPFAGSSMKQLILHHLQSAPDLSLLPSTDRACVSRALSKNPEDRFPTCREFVQQLREATSAKPAGAESGGRQSGAFAITRPADTTSQYTADARGKALSPVQPAEPNFSTEEVHVGQRPNILPPRPESREMQPPSTDPLSRPSVSAGPRGQKDKTGSSPQSRRALGGLLQPAVIVGLGQLGVEALTQLRRRLHEEHGVGDPFPQLRVIGIDTDPDAIQLATNNPTATVLSIQETILTRLQRPANYIKSRDGKLPTDSWLNPKFLYRIPRDQGRAGLRSLGRLALVDNYRMIAKRLETDLLACCADDGAGTRGLGLRSTTPRVYIVTSLMGNAGSGMFLDVAYLARKLLRAQGHEEAEVVGVFFVPDVCRDAKLAPALMNTYASLVELHHFSERQALFSAHYEISGSSAKDQISEAGPAFDRCIMLVLPEPQGQDLAGSNFPTLALAGDYLRRDLTTALGPASDEQRRQKIDHSPDAQRAGSHLLQSLGMFRVLWPRRMLLERCARRMCFQLVTRWMSKDAKPMVDAIRPWTAECWESLGMRADNLIEHFQLQVERALQQKPEQMLAEILNPLREALAASAKTNDIDIGAVARAMEQLESLAGSPEENRSLPTPAEPSVLERALAEVARSIADECEQKLAELAVKLLEDPQYRLAGAEEALRQFSATVDKSLQSQETLAKELGEQTNQLHLRVLQWLDESKANARKGGAKRAPAGKNVISANDYFELVRSYAKTRYHSLTLTHLNNFYLGLRGHLSDQIREVGFCRQRLGELLSLVQPVAEPRGKKSEPKLAENVLYPAGCLEMDDAIEKINQEITPTDLLSFDERVQTWIRAHCEALLQVCMGSSATVKALAPAMLQEAQEFLDERLRGTSVAEMYLTRKRAEGDEVADDMIVDDLQRCYDKAMPELGPASDANDLSIACLPKDAPGKELQRMLNKYLPELETLMTDRQDEIVFYRESISIGWKDLEQIGSVARELYQKRNAADPSSLHSREDIAEWQSFDIDE